MGKKSRKTDQLEAQNAKKEERNNKHALYLIFQKVLKLQDGQDLLEAEFLHMISLVNKINNKKNSEIKNKIDSSFDFFYGHTLRTWAVAHKKNSFAKQLLNAGASLTARTINDYTAMLCALERKNIHWVEFIIKHYPQCLDNLDEMTLSKYRNRIFYTQRQKSHQHVDEIEKLMNLLFDTDIFDQDSYCIILLKAIEKNCLQTAHTALEKILEFPSPNYSRAKFVTTAALKLGELSKSQNSSELENLKKLLIKFFEQNIKQGKDPLKIQESILDELEYAYDIGKTMDRKKISEKKELIINNLNFILRMDHLIEIPLDEQEIDRLESSSNDLNDEHSTLSDKKKIPRTQRALPRTNSPIVFSKIEEQLIPPNSPNQRDTRSDDKFPDEIPDGFVLEI